MNGSDQNFDEYGKRILSPLRQVPSMDAQSAAEARKQFLLQGESLRQGLISQPAASERQTSKEKTNIFAMFRHKPLLKGLVAVVFAVLVILSGSSITVAAAQGSLPGEPLYAIKSWSEDVRLSMTRSTEAKLNLTLDYTNRRVDEISGLLAGGKVLNDQTSDRFQQELDNALQLAAQLDDNQLHIALGQIKKHAQSQGMTIEELIDMLPSQAEPTVIHLQRRLDEQVQLSVFGEMNPQAFREQMHLRHQKQQGPIHPAETVQPESIEPGMTVTPIPERNEGNGGNKMQQSTDTPGQANPGNGKGQNTPGNGNHGPNESSPQQP